MTKESSPEPDSTTSEKPSIRKAQEEFIGDEAQPSLDKSELSSGGQHKQQQQPSAPAADSSNTIKDPNTWTTGDEPATGAQMSYLKTLASETKFEFDEGARISKAEASKLIDQLRHESGRVATNDN